MNLMILRQVRRKLMIQLGHFKENIIQIFMFYL